MKKNHGEATWKKKSKIHEYSFKWSEYMKGTLLNNRMEELKQEAEVKYYQQGGG